jgi:5'-deoxynucleotidase YfbR-like HD superfamily hydrolase
MEIHLKQTVVKESLQEILFLWKELYQSHLLLFEINDNEYQDLLHNHLDKLPSYTQQKEDVILIIKNLDQKRKKILDSLSEKLLNAPVHHITELKNIFQENLSLNETQQFFHLNDQLSLLMTNLREQNKRNRIYINKLLMHIKEITRKTHSQQFIYNAQGTISSLR